ncbi:Acetoin:2,6-dichlorophenolindophenol oxidoreductase subunit alpha [Orientia tsutsugamushi]|nr:Acetoin:2,6-dichlorophenolindophenol oxidoreductase subunit alpha [Orientia tsutsugamushi]
MYIGQDAVLVGVVLAKQHSDCLITSDRDHRHAILSSIEPKYVLAELCGKATGCSKGKCRSTHMFNIDHNFYGNHSIVGTQVL